MEKPFLLHMFTSEKNISPFDANMAFDAGWDSIIPYTDVDMDDIQALVQDTIFSRSPSALKKTGIFIGLSAYWGLILVGTLVSFN